MGLDFDEWMLTKDKSHVPTDDSMSLRLLRECWFRRDAEIVSLTNQRDYEYVRAENAEQERDQLRKQVLLLREVMNRIAFSRVGTCENIALELFNREAWAIEALSATEQKP